MIPAVSARLNGAMIVYAPVTAACPLTSPAPIASSVLSNPINPAEYAFVIIKDVAIVFFPTNPPTFSPYR